MYSVFAALVLLAPLVTAQAPAWGQCGGQGWTGPTTCVSGYTCVYSNPWYSQCTPGQATSSTPSSSTTTTTTTTTTTSDSGTTTSATSTGGGTAPTNCPAIPASVSYSNSKLPDPFKFVGTGARTATKADFACRQQEISALFQKYELGTLPPKPANVSGSISGNTLTVRVTEAGKSISFTVSISYPSSGSAPYPAIIGLSGASIPVPNTVATITLNTDNIARQDGGSSRGQGNFYTIYGAGHSAGALTAWAWGVGRVLDVLESLGTSATRIDPKRVGVTGCSRWGKGAFVAGALEPRIALTIAQESGSGGAACWRLSDSQQSRGQNVQTLGEIIGENVWFSTALNAFSGKTNTLSIDHHLLAALVAPRGLLVIENTSMEWLGSESTNGCMRTGRKVYDALGISSSMGYSQVGNHNHCAFPSSQSPELTAFIGKFLLGQNTNTTVLKTDGGFTFSESQWIDWTVPTLT